MLLAVLLAATASATPPPQALAPLKVIGSVRATPLCSTLRNSLVPAIAALIENDATIDKAPPIFNAMYQHALTNAWRDGSPYFFLDNARLEYLIGPLAVNIKLIDTLLADKNAFSQNPKSDDERRLAQMRDKLKAIEQQQQLALNTISGYNATALTANMIDENVPGSWQKVFSTSALPSNPAASTHSTPIALQQSTRASGDPRSGTSPLNQDSNLARNAFSPLAQYIVAVRSDGAAAEAAAAGVISPIAAYCESK